MSAEEAKAYSIVDRGDRAPLASIRGKPRSGAGLQGHSPDEQAATKLIHFLLGAAIVVAIVLGWLGVFD